MDLDTFRARFDDASRRARDFAQRFVEETLPVPLVFRVHLNASHDRPPYHPDITVHPEDSDRDPSELARRAGEEVIELLWRRGAVPVWINLSATGVTSDATVIEVLAAGRFTANDALLYHEQEGRPPFHVLGPDLPPGWQQGQRFSIHRNAECWRAEEMSPVCANRDKVWSLTLAGSAFDEGDRQDARLRGQDTEGDQR